MLVRDKQKNVTWFFGSLHHLTWVSGGQQMKKKIILMVKLNEESDVFKKQSGFPQSQSDQQSLNKVAASFELRSSFPSLSDCFNEVRNCCPRWQSSSTQGKLTWVKTQPSKNKISFIKINLTASFLGQSSSRTGKKRNRNKWMWTGSDLQMSITREERTWAAWVITSGTYLKGACRMEKEEWFGPPQEISARSLRRWNETRKNQNGGAFPVWFE